MNKKGYNIRDLMPVALIIVVAVIAIAIGADVLGTIQDDQTSGSYSYNASEAGLDGLNELSGWVPTIALVVAAAIVIGVLVYSFAFRS